MKGLWGGGVKNGPRGAENPPGVLKPVFKVQIPESPSRKWEDQSKKTKTGRGRKGKNIYKNNMVGDFKPR